MLPIYEIADSLVRAAARPENARIVIEAPTGSGKSTQAPQMLIDRGAVGGAGEIVILQPRRLAARMLARRVAWERRSKCGGEVGYTIRFEDQSGPATRIRYVTEGVLLRRLLSDPALKGIAAVIFDEFHERHFYGDVTLARCLETQETVRPDLKLIVMSATLQVEELNAYLGESCEHLISEGRTFPVEIQYRPPRQRHNDKIWDHVARALDDHFKKHGAEGHALIFLPGAHEIRKTMEAIGRQSWSRRFALHALYGELPPEKQDAAVEPSERPKIVCATNVAETSITIDGVRLVVDTGLERRSDFDVRRGLGTLTIEKISRASADQRAGRAGRTAPGVCLRLWSEEDHAARPAATPAEIHRMDLAEAVLLLKASGIDDVRGFRWFEAPEAAALEQAIRWLITLRALERGSESLTRLGRELSRLPLAPRFGRVLLEAAEHGCLEFFAVAAAATQGRSLFPKQKRNAADLAMTDFVEEGDVSDFQALFRAWNGARGMRFDRDRCGQLGVNANVAREIDRMARQFISLVNRSIRARREAGGEAMPNGETIARVLLTGFSDRLAIRHSPHTLACAVIGGRRGELEKSSVAASSGAKDDLLFLAGEMVEVEGKDLTVRLSLATRIREEWLREMFPDDFSKTAGAAWDETARRVVARSETRFRDLVLESRPSGEPPEDAAAEILAREIREGRLVLKKWDTAAEQWVARINTLAAAYPEYEIESIDAGARLMLLTEICRGGFGYKQIKDRPVMPVLKSWLPPHQAPLLNRLAPERIELSNGRLAKVIYSSEPGVKPKISVLIQHLFGVKTTPSVAGGRIPLVVEILAPNSRPCQTTEDLAGFWTGSYAGVRAQLRGRYPKHDWPEPGQMTKLE